MERQTGSIFFYLMLAVILFAALSAAVMALFRGGGDYGRSEVARLGAHAVVEYADKAKLIVQDMKISGVSTSDLSFLRDGDAGYTTVPHTYKVFHPEGGGLPVPNFDNILDLPKQTVDNDRTVYMSYGLVINAGTNDSDLVLTIVPIRQDVCKQVEKDLYGTEMALTVSGNFTDTLGVTNPGDPITCEPLTDCYGHMAGCMYFPEGFYGFYSVIDVN